MNRNDHRIDHIAIVVPTRDEEAHIERTLASLDHARALLPPRVTSSCVVVADCCTDRSAELARRWRGAMPSLEVVESDRGLVGAARAIGVAHALSHSAHPAARVWLAGTDADTVVPADWLEQQLTLAERGADAIAGIVELDPATEAGLRKRFAASYRVDQGTAHQHVHGANFGVRADAYLDVGGWRDLATGEDHDLWRRMGRRHTCVSSTAIVVHTSGRLTGRAPAGFADDLVALTNGRTVA